MIVKDYIARIKKPTYIKIVDDKTLYYHGRSDRVEIERWFNKKVVDMEVKTEYMTPLLVLYVEPPREIKLGEIITLISGAVLLKYEGAIKGVLYFDNEPIPEKLCNCVVKEIRSHNCMTEIKIAEL